tara:strand:- start:259 stop:489 length:231 start_codon:yes stop_codon:yes gene_type:complete
MMKTKREQHNERKEQKRTGIGDSTMRLFIHVLLLFIFCSFFDSHSSFHHPTHFSLSRLAFFLFFILFPSSFLYPMP